MTDRSLACHAQREEMRDHASIPVLKNPGAIGAIVATEILKHSFDYSGSRKWLRV